MEKLLVDLLQHQDNRLRIFDMGRRIEKLSIDQFTRIEKAEIPYPNPFLHHAWVGLLIWSPAAKEQNLIWFLKLPLDEQGYLVQAARDDIINRLLQNVIDPESTEDALKDNPFSFTPDPEKMACFHAKASRILQTPASRYYEEVQQYMAGQHPLEYWSHLGLQGIADYAMRLDQGQNNQQLCEILNRLPDPLLMTLCRMLEHVQPDHRLQSALSKLVKTMLSAEDSQPEKLAACIRGLSNSIDMAGRDALLDELLETPYALEAEVIAAIATRCHHSLMTPSRLLQLLECLAKGKAGQQGFTRILSDLMFLPDMRLQILAAFRNPARSEHLSQAIGEMLGFQLSGSSQPH
ncbi:DUF3549 family protein [Nitrincola schmidtii]|uniref:DUF3549 family protein n=1 Tax=Nitrincola schmidtii TaxID=1730894 RepID=UPI00124D277A|nr:DUF3549 family protein [Nitrincola schmidtii]